MSIIDRVTSLLPFRSERERERSQGTPGRSELLAFRDDVDRWIQRFFEEPEGAFTGGLRWAPAVDVRETDGEVVMTAEVPGLEPEDIDLTLTPEGVTIRGEKREEREDRRGDVHVAERRYGSFVRTVPLPPGIDVDRGEARVERGVLTVKFPKTPAKSDSRRVPIQS